MKLTAALRSQHMPTAAYMGSSTNSLRGFRKWDWLSTHGGVWRNNKKPTSPLCVPKQCRQNFIATIWDAILSHKSASSCVSCRTFLVLSLLIWVTFIKGLLVLLLLSVIPCLCATNHMLLFLCSKSSSPHLANLQHQASHFLKKQWLLFFHSGKAVASKEWPPCSAPPSSLFLV